MNNDTVPCRAAELIVPRIGEWNNLVSGPEADLALPFEDSMQMADRVMEAIKAGLQTDVEWVSADRDETTVVLRWQQGDKQLELELIFTLWGFLASLYPDYVSHGTRGWLVGWQATRATSPYDSGRWPGGEPGALDVHRLERSFHVTGLTFDDPVFDGLARVRAKNLPEPGKPTELVADIVMVTQEHLRKLGI